MGLTGHPGGRLIFGVWSPSAIAAHTKRKARWYYVASIGDTMKGSAMRDLWGKENRARARGETFIRPDEWRALRARIGTNQLLGDVFNVSRQTMSVWCTQGKIARADSPLGQTFRLLTLIAEVFPNANLREVIEKGFLPCKVCGKVFEAFEKGDEKLQVYCIKCRKKWARGLVP